MFSTVITALINSKPLLKDFNVDEYFQTEILASSYRDDYMDDQSEKEYDSRPPKRYSPRQQSFSTLGGLLKNQKQMGAGLLGVGALLTVMGMMLFFEGTLLRLGNICIIAGIPLLVGIDRVRGFFMKESRIQASSITAVGILLVFWGKPRLGILCELFGLLNLFGNMLPLLLALCRRLPIIGDVITAFEGKPDNRKAGADRERPRPARREAGGRPPQKRYNPDF